MQASQSQYDPGFAAFGAGSSGSVLHPLVLVATIGVIAVAFLLPRKHVIVPLLLAILLIPAGQNLNVGVHLYVFRILILVGWLRSFISKPESGKFLEGGFTTLDKVFLLWAVYRAMAGTLQFMQTGALIYQVALLLDSVGAYFLFRSLIRADKDVQKVVIVFAAVAFVSSIVMVGELMTGQNVMGLLGGIRLISDVRNGRIRAQGVFAHSILAGSVGATIFPLFFWLWKQGSNKLAATAGSVSATIMVFTCASSTPVAAWFGTFVVVCLWPLRNQMRLVRWALVVSLCTLALLMKAPIWYVLARIDFAGGSSGWERAFLIDTFMRHFEDWWLIGTHTSGTWGWDMWDQANQYVSEGESGGLLVLVCFITMIVICFKRIGNVRKLVTADRRMEWSAWFLGAAMFAQVLAFIGVDYFDQSRFVWFALLAFFPAISNLVEGGISRDWLEILPLKSAVPASRSETIDLWIKQKGEHLGGSNSSTL